MENDPKNNLLPMEVPKRALEPFGGWNEFHKKLAPHLEHLMVRVSQLVEPRSDRGTVLAVTSCQKGEGVTTAALGLASALAWECDRPPLLIDVNFWDPEAHLALGLAPGPGLADILVGRGHRRCFQIPHGDKPFHFLAVGRKADQVPGSIFRSKSFITTLSVMRKSFPWIILDLPPLSRNPSLAEFCGKIDGVVLMVEAEGVRTEVVERHKAHLDEAGAYIVGAILNKRRYYVPKWLYRRL